jgi:glucose/arabinose dehydrogenase
MRTPGAILKRSILPLLGGLLFLNGLQAQTPLTTQRIASGLRNAVWAGAPAGDERVWVCQKNGAIKLIKNGQLLGTNFMAINGQVSGGSEQGLLGMAFHPDYANNGEFFLNYTRGDGATVVSRWNVDPVDPDRGDLTSEEVLIVIPQPFSNHNAGDIAFGPNDGYLYIPTGDGGSGNDPACNAQNLNNLLGKMLRIDVDGGPPYAIPPDNPFVGVAGTRAEVYHYGLRNPFRIGFDSATGDLYMGDVGQNAREEISFSVAGAAGVNFGWKVIEGTRCNSSASCPMGQAPCADTGYEAPLYELFSSAGAHSIIGGVVYRGCAIPDLVGTYFFADYYDDQIRTFEYDVNTSTVNNFQDRTAELVPAGGFSIRSIADFGEDGFGEILIVDNAGAGNGEVFKVVPAVASEATAAVWNGSLANSVCYSSLSKPILGNNWRSEVDVSAHAGATISVIQGRVNRTSGAFFKGEELLVTGPKLFKVSKLSSGTLDTFDGPLPCDISLNGLVGHVQAYILGGAGLELCNALTTTLGSW